MNVVLLFNLFKINFLDKTLNLNLVVSIKPAALYNSARNYFDSAQPIDTPSFENVLPRKEIRKHKVRKKILCTNNVNT